MKRNSLETLHEIASDPSTLAIVAAGRIVHLIGSADFYAQGNRTFGRPILPGCIGDEAIAAN